MSALVPWKTARRIFATFWLAGAALVVVGLLGDSRGAWTNHQFLLNLLSALCGFFFGAPVVLSILRQATQRIDREQQELSDLRNDQLQEDRRQASDRKAEEERRLKARERALDDERSELASKRANLERQSNRLDLRQSELTESALARERDRMAVWVEQRHDLSASVQQTVDRVRYLVDTRATKLRRVELSKLDIDKQLERAVDELEHLWSQVAQSPLPAGNQQERPQSPITPPPSSGLPLFISIEETDT